MRWTDFVEFRVISLIVPSSSFFTNLQEKKTEPFAVANGCEHTGSVHFSMIDLHGKSGISDVIEYQDPLATANGFCIV